MRVHDGPQLLRLGGGKRVGHEDHLPVGDRGVRVAHPRSANVVHEDRNFSAVAAEICLVVHLSLGVEPCCEGAMHFFVGDADDPRIPVGRGPALDERGGQRRIRGARLDVVVGVDGPRHVHHTIGRVPHGRAGHDEQKSLEAAETRGHDVALQIAIQCGRPFDATLVREERVGGDEFKLVRILRRRHRRQHRRPPAARDEQRGLAHVHAVAKLHRERSVGLVGMGRCLEQFCAMLLDHPDLIDAKVEGDSGLVPGDQALRHAIDGERKPVTGRLVKLEPQSAVGNGDTLVGLEAGDVAESLGLLEGFRRWGRLVRRSTARDQRHRQATSQSTEQGRPK